MAIPIILIHGKEFFILFNKFDTRYLLSRITGSDNISMYRPIKTAKGKIFYNIIDDNFLDNTIRDIYIIFDIPTKRTLFKHKITGLMVALLYNDEYDVMFPPFPKMHNIQTIASYITFKGYLNNNMLTIETLVNDPTLVPQTITTAFVCNINNSDTIIKNDILSIIAKAFDDEYIEKRYNV